MCTGARKRKDCRKLWEKSKMRKMVIRYLISAIEGAHHGLCNGMPKD